MVELARIILATAFAGSLSWFLGTILFAGLKTGSIRHTDSTSVCRRDRHPLAFWALTALFAGMIVLLAAVWVSILIDAAGKM